MTGSTDHEQDTQAPPPRRCIEDWIGALVMAVLALITFANVLARYFTDESFAWTEEISISLMVVLAMISTGAAVVRDRHIRIEFFYEGGGPSRRRGMAMLSAAATAVCFLCVAGLGTRLAWDDWQFEVTSPGIGVPQWWYTVWLPLLSLAVAVRAMQQLVAAWRSR